MKQQIDQLTSKEQDWVASQLDAAAELVEAFFPNDTGQPLTLSALDRAFATWLTSSPSGVDLINQGINAFGLAFGQFLVDGVGLRWVIATDEYGSELAVYGLPGVADILIYPANFVAKRWERRETNFLESAYIKVAREVGALAEPRRKP